MRRIRDDCTTAQLFKIAYGKYALGAYNINNLEQTVGLFKGNVQSKAPFIIQLSKGARKYTDKRYLEAMIRTSEQVFPEAIFAVHLDHGDEQTCYDCIDSGFLQFGDDRCQPRAVREKRRDHQTRRGQAPTRAACPSKPNSGCSAASKKTSPATFA